MMTAAVFKFLYAGTPEYERFKFEEHLRRSLWEHHRPLEFDGDHPFWTPYSRSVRSYLAHVPAGPALRVSNSERTLLEPVYKLDEPPALLVSGGLDSTYAYWAHNLCGKGLGTLPKVVPISLDNTPRLQGMYEDLRVLEGWWHGQVELGGPFLLLRHGYGEVWFGGEDDGSTYSAENRWPEGPQEMPDVSQHVWTAWKAYTGQTIREANAHTNKIVMLQMLSKNAPELLKKVSSCLSLGASGFWCGECTKCLLMEAMYHAAGLSAPVLFHGGNFRHPSFRDLTQVQSLLDNIVNVLKPHGFLKAPESRSIRAFLKEGVSL